MTEKQLLAIVAGQIFSRSNQLMPHEQALDTAMSCAQEIISRCDAQFPLAVEIEVHPMLVKASDQNLREANVAFDHSNNVYRPLPGGDPVKALAEIKAGGVSAPQHQALCRDLEREIAEKAKGQPPAVQTPPEPSRTPVSIPPGVNPWGGTASPVIPTPPEAAYISKSPPAPVVPAKPAIPLTTVYDWSGMSCDKCPSDRLFFAISSDPADSKCTFGCRDCGHTGDFEIDAATRSTITTQGKPLVAVVASEKSATPSTPPLAAPAAGPAATPTRKRKNAAPAAPEPHPAPVVNVPPQAPGIRGLVDAIIGFVPVPVSREAVTREFTAMVAAWDDARLIDKYQEISKQTFTNQSRETMRAFVVDAMLHRSVGAA